MFQLEVGYGCRKVEANQALNRMEANQALNRVEANQVLNRVEGRQHHSLGFRRAAPAQTGASLTEALWGLELPKLPAPGSADASLLFGDWMTVVYPIMCDVAGSAGEWWTQTVSTVEHHYVQ